MEETTMAAITAKSRAQLRLEAITTMPPASALAAVKEATGDVKGGGASLLTSGLQNLGAQVHVERESAERLDLSINSGKRIVELCTFSARLAVPRHDGKVVLHVGGLETYKTSQSKFMGLIPTGPKSVAGMAPYKHFLDAVSERIRQQDPGAEVTISVPTAD
jgi:hypothetical protein